MKIFKLTWWGNEFELLIGETLAEATSKTHPRIAKECEGENSFQNEDYNCRELLTNEPVFTLSQLEEAIELARETQEFNLYEPKYSTNKIISKLISND